MTEPCVFLHGIGSNANAFTEVIALVGGRCVAWNTPGYSGTTPLPLPQPTVEDYAAALVDDLALPSFRLVGSSLGALIAAATAARYPERVTSLLLTAPVTGSGRTPETARAELEAREALIALGPEKMAAVRVPELIAGGAPEALRSARAATLALDPTAYLQAAHALAFGDIFAYTPHIQAPTLVVCGTADTVSPADRHARPIAEAITDAGLVLVEGPGHLVELEAPGRLAELVTRTRTRTRPSSPRPAR